MKQALNMIGMEMRDKDTIQRGCRKPVGNIHQAGINQVSLVINFKQGGCRAAPVFSIQSDHGTAVTVTSIQGHAGCITRAQQCQAHFSFT
jgi:hypothetical protein